MQPVGGSDDERLRQAAAVAAVAHGAGQAVAGAVLADLTAAQQNAVGAEQAKVVQRLHNGHAGAFGGAHHGGAEQQQCVMNMHSIDVFCLDNALDIARGGAVPDGMQGQEGFGQAVGGFLITALVHEDLVAVALKHGALSRKDGILAARQAVMAMHEENFHRERPPLSAFLARMGIDGLLCYYNLFWGWVQDGELFLMGSFRSLPPCGSSLL